MAWSIGRFTTCDGPTRSNFAAYWSDANKNPALGAFLDILRERYPDLSPVVAID